MNYYNQLIQSQQYKLTMYYLATICGFVVGVFTFFRNAWVENEFGKKIASATLSTLNVVDNVSSILRDNLEDGPVAEPAESGAKTA